MTRGELEVRLIKKAWQDNAFKRALLGDARKAIEKAENIKLPGDMEIKVFEETANRLYIVLPVNPAAFRQVT